MNALVPRHVSDRLLEARVVLLTDEVSDESAQRVISELLTLSIDDPASDVCLLINSPGGSVVAGLAIYDVLQALPNDVVTVAAGFAASMGQVLLCAGTPGKRFVFPHAQVLMHEGSAGIGGAAADVEIQAANLLATSARLRAIIARHTGQPLSTVERDVGRDRWFDAEQALAYGFADRIVTTLADIVPRRAERRIGLSVSAA